MGGVAALAAVVVLGDGSLAAADLDPAAPRHVEPTPRPRIVAVIAEAVPPELEVPVASRLRGPARRFVASRIFSAASRTLGADPRTTQPAAVIGLVEPVPLLLIHGEADTTVPIADGRRLAAMAGPTAEHWVVPGAEHSRAHAAAPQDYEQRTTDFLRMAFQRGRAEHPGEPGAGPIIATPGDPAGVHTIGATPMED
jgi:fermentation-respiration switch protein FrsA (DUF1100 family)